MQLNYQLLCPLASVVKRVAITILYIIISISKIKEPNFILFLVHLPLTTRIGESFLRPFFYLIQIYGSYSYELQQLVSSNDG